MKNIIRIFALILALLMVATCFVACKGKGDPVASSSNIGPSNPLEGEYVSKLPADKNWDGEEYLVLGQNTNGNVAWHTFEIAREEEASDVVGKAVYDRNLAIKDKYNLVIKEELQAMSYTYIQSYYSSNEDKYDMAMYQLEGIFGHAQDGYLKDISSLEYIDFDHPTWNKSTNDQLTLGTSVFATNSKFNLQNKAAISCIFYNRELATNAGDGYIEDLVTTNQWTLDKYTELVKKYADDKDGNGNLGDFGDAFGTCGDVWNFLTYAQGAGYRASTVVNGEVQLVGAGEAVINILKEVGDFYWDAQSCFRTEARTGYNDFDSINMFLDGRSLFACLQVIDKDNHLSDVSFEMGVLPTPKLNSSQENFYSTVNFRYSSLCAVPYTVMDTSFAGFGLEALAEYSAAAGSTYDAYIETKCKVQSAVDQRMYDMYEIIFANPVYDIAIIGNFGTMADIIRSDVPKEGNAASYATHYQANSEAAMTKINELMEDIRNIGA